jgi:hypothetical protein
VAIPLFGRVPGRAFGPSRSRVDDGGGSRCVSGKLIGSLGFSRHGVFIGEGAASEVDKGGPHHRAARPGAGSRPLVVRLAIGPSSSPLRSSGSFVKYWEVRLLFRPIPGIFPV